MIEYYRVIAHINPVTLLVITIDLYLIMLLLRWMICHMSDRDNNILFVNINRLVNLLPNNIAVKILYYLQTPTPTWLTFFRLFLIIVFVRYFSTWLVLYF